MFQRFSRFLSTRFWLTLLAAVVLLGVVWGIAWERVHYERDRAVADEIRKNANLAQSHQERASRSFQVLDQALLFLRADYLAHGIPASLARRIEPIRLDKKYLGIVSLIGSQGQLLATTGDTLLPNYADREYFKRHAADPSDQMLIGKPILGRVSGNWIITLTRRINQPDGSFGGVVFMALDPAYFASDYAKTEQGARGAMALIGLDGITRARRNGDKISFGEDIKASQLFNELPKAANGHYIGVAASDGHRRIVAYRSLEDYPMVTIVGSSLEDVLALSAERERVYLGAAVVSTLLVIFFAFTYLVVSDRRAMARAALQISLREKTALLMEVHHRVKNNLQVIISLLRLESMRSDHEATKSVLKDMQGRIRAMALLHETIYRKDTFAAIDLGQYLGEIANQSLHVLLGKAGRIQLRLEVGTLQVGLEQATPCGLLISELISNCLKHAFPDDQVGEICIELSPLPGTGESGETGIWRLRVSDNGVGLPADFEARQQNSLGLQLASDLARQMGGSLHTGAGPQAVFTVEFKAAPLASLEFDL